MSTDILSTLVVFRTENSQVLNVGVKHGRRLCDLTSEFQEMDIVKQDKCIKALKDKDMSVRQIGRLTLS